MNRSVQHRWKCLFRVGVSPIWKVAHASLLVVPIFIAATTTLGQVNWRPLVADKRYDEAATVLARSLVSERGDEAALALTEICRYITNWHSVLPSVKSLVTDVKLSPNQIDLVANVCLFATPNQQPLLDDLISRVSIEAMPRGSLTKAVMAYETYGDFAKSRPYELVRKQIWQRELELHKSLTRSGRREVLERFRVQPSAQNFEALVTQVNCNLLLGEDVEIVDELEALEERRPESSVVCLLVAAHKDKQTEAEAKLKYAMKAWDKSEVRALPVVVESLIALKMRDKMRPLVPDLIRFRQTHPMVPFGLARLVSSANRIEDGRELFLRTFRGLNRDLIDQAPSLKELMEKCMRELRLDYADLQLLESQ